MYNRCKNIRPEWKRGNRKDPETKWEPVVGTKSHRSTSSILVLVT